MRTMQHRSQQHAAGFRSGGFSLAARAVRLGLVLVLGIAAHIAVAQAPVTVAEASNFERTSRSDEVRAFIAALAEQSSLVRVSSLGASHEGREIPLVLLADPPVEKPEDVKDRLVVLLIGNIHAGEVAGKEALQMLMRDIALASIVDAPAETQQAVLKHLVLCFVPNYNPDGNDRFGAENRPGQVGPIEMGTRANAQGLDLNRDYVKLAAPETRALIALMNRWDPAIVIDTHTTNGSHHRYTLTYSGPKHPAADPAIVAFVRDSLLPTVGAAVKERSNFDTFWYGNFADGFSAWTTYPAEPRYGEGYVSMRNRLPILSEAYSYAPYKDRVLATYAFCREILAFAASEKNTIAGLIRDADKKTIDAGREPDGSAMLSLQSEARAFAEPVTALGFIERDADGNTIPPVEPTEYSVRLINDFVSTLEVPRAFAYLLPPQHAHIAQHLQHQGVAVEVLREDIEIDIEVDTIDGFTRSERAFEGHHLVRDIAATRTSQSRRIEAGWYVVRTAQKLGTLASYLLEPQAADGLATWNFFDDDLIAGGQFPVLRVPAKTSLLTRTAPPLPDPTLVRKRLRYDDVYGNARVNLSGSPAGGLVWLDDEHYLHRKNGEARKVHAMSGRSEPFVEATTDQIAERLATLPTIDEKAAREIARRSFARLQPDEKGRVFTHENDLYYATADATYAVRLTSTPTPEELALLSPDSAFVAFVRDNDLYVVDVQTATERAITSGGSDTLRHGKHCWLYFEELYNRNWRAFWWSPDSLELAYFSTDTSGVPIYTIVDDAPRPHRVETERWSRPGEPNPHVEVFIASRAGGTPRKVDLSGYDKGAYLVSWIAWSRHANVLRLGVQDRVQTWLDLLTIKPGSPSTELLMRETTEAWVEPQGSPRELDDGTFILASERDGYKHLYHFNADGSVRARITDGPWEVRSITHVDEAAGIVYFEGTADASTQSHFYRVNIDGSDITRLTRQGGSHRVQLNKAATMFIDSWSDIDQPTQVGLFAIDGSLLRMIDTNPVYELDEWELGRIERVTIVSEKGNELELRITYPTDFDPDRRYPVWMQTYAGPRAPTVSDSWGGARLGDRLLAELGIVAVQADPYPASGKGAASAWTAYKQLGVRELEDLSEVVAWLAEKPWVDQTRIGLSGHSYGGFMTAFAMTNSTLFAAGISGAPVTEWYEYDSIYTERYMLTPQMNPDGYKKTSTVLAAKNLHGRLLLLHGMIDDNVHLQNAVRLTDALVRAGKQFEMFYYPSRRHGLGGAHYSRLMHDFIVRTMQPELIVPAKTSEQPDGTPAPTDAQPTLGT